MLDQAVSLGFVQTTHVRVIITVLSHKHMGYNPIQNGGEAETNLTIGLKLNVIIAYTPSEHNMILFETNISKEHWIPI